MTREQALHYLKSSGFSKEQIQAIVEALSSSDNLSSELEKNSKKLEKVTAKNILGVDCIDRKATLNAIIKRLGIKNETYLLEAERAIYQQILAMPSVTPQEPRLDDAERDMLWNSAYQWGRVEAVKKGHWISHREHCEQNNSLPSGLGSYFWCSECDCGIDSKVFHRVNYNYCPNCGCKME